MKVYSKIGQEANEFAQRIEDSQMHLEMIVHATEGKQVALHEVKGLFIVTESSVYKAGEGRIKQKDACFRIRATEGNNVTNHDYPLGEVSPYVAETALCLELHPSKLALKPQSAQDHLASFGAGDQEIAIYQDLGMSSQDAAQAIRMQHEMAESDQDDTQAASDFMASLSSDDLMANDRGMSL